MGPTASGIRWTRCRTCSIASSSGCNAWGHHLTNVLLHAATSIALFLVLWRMTGELWPSAFVAALFAVHPQHVESVAWVPSGATC